MGEPRVPLILHRCKFIFPFDHADQQRKVIKAAENIIGPNGFTDFAHLNVFDAQVFKKIVATNWPNYAGDGLTLRQNRFTSHVT